MPGYPKNNPILGGMASILKGQDPELAMALRDEQLPDPLSFARAAIEAACWIEPGSVLLDDLLSQANLAWERAGENDKILIAHDLLGRLDEGQDQLLPLCQRWNIGEGI